MKQLWAFSALLAISALYTVACAIPIRETISFPVQTIPGTGVVLDPSVPPQSISFSNVTGSYSIPAHNLNKGIYIESFAIRSVLDDENDQTKSALEDESLVDVCPAGRASMAFVDSATIKIRHQSEDDSKAVAVATYTRDPSIDPTQLCGFGFDIKKVDISGYLKDYEFVIEASGLPPQDSVKVGGYIEIKALEGL